jgi:hypothetical protein
MTVNSLGDIVSMASPALALILKNSGQVHDLLSGGLAGISSIGGAEDDTTSPTDNSINTSNTLFISLLSRRGERDCTYKHARI